MPPWASPAAFFYARLWLSGRQALPALLAELTILLRRHTNVLAKGTVEAATGAKTGGQGNVEDRLIGVAEQGAHVLMRIAVIYCFMVCCITRWKMPMA